MPDSEGMPQRHPELANDDQRSTKSLEMLLNCGTARETDEQPSVRAQPYAAEQPI
jgi:hypothetical protein